MVGRNRLTSDGTRRGGRLPAADEAHDVRGLWPEDGGVADSAWGTLSSVASGASHVNGEIGFSGIPPGRGPKI